MKNNMFMALASALLNSVALVIGQKFATPDAMQSIMAMSGLLSPFLSIYLLKVYIRADDPPELTRAIGSLNASIKTCEAHLKEKSASAEFKEKTRKQMEDLQTKLQSIRADFESGRAHTITPFAASGDDQ